MKFYKQQDKPLFESLLWAETERRPSEPQVLILGGHSQNINAPLNAFAYLKAMKIKASVILPDVLKSFFQSVKDKDLPLVFAPSTPAGSFAHSGMSQILELAQKHACLLLAGDLSSNQETIQLATALITKLDQPKIVSGQIAKTIISSNQMTDQKLQLVLETSQLQTLIGKNILKNINSAQTMADCLADLKVAFDLVFIHKQFVWIKSRDKICATFLKGDDSAESTLKLATQTAGQLSDNSQDTWSALVNAAWRYKLSSELSK